ncbi:hypothetical protein [Gorillibacterium sp. sgz5001074]|uniref:hypothetical protein n=1 Tax=Gorillibacterium sp. sgz5001074 TaxID=3446695 RepID=UPI003F67FA0A
MELINTVLLLAILLVLLRMNSKLSRRDPHREESLRDRLRSENRRTLGLDQPTQQENETTNEDSGGGLR